MNIFARFDENPAMTLEDIKETKRYGRTDGRTHGRTDNVKTVYPPQTKFAGGIIKYRSKQRGPQTDCSYRSSLIWVHTVCLRGFLNISADKKSRRLLLRYLP